jgi:hypothetical protein
LTPANEQENCRSAIFVGFGVEAKRWATSFCPDGFGRLAPGVSQVAAGIRCGFRHQLPRSASEAGAFRNSKPDALGGDLGRMTPSKLALCKGQGREAAERAPTTLTSARNSEAMKLGSIPIASSGDFLGTHGLG